MCNILIYFVMWRITSRFIMKYYSCALFYSLLSKKIGHTAAHIYKVFNTLEMYPTLIHLTISSLEDKIMSSPVISLWASAMMHFVSQGSLCTLWSDGKDLIVYWYINYLWYTVVIFHFGQTLEMWLNTFYKWLKFICVILKLNKFFRDILHNFKAS